MQSIKLGSAYGEIIIDASGVKKQVGEARDHISTLGTHGAKAGKMLAAGLVAGVAVVTGAMAAVVGSGVKMAADLEAQMSGIKAVMGATAEETNQLKDKILQLGVDPQLKITTQEAAEAIEMLGRNGLSTSEILEGAARNTVLLANATGGEFGQAADIATDVMALFNIEAADMEAAVDSITSVVNNSKFTMDDYQLALANLGGVSSIIGLEFNDMNVALAAVAPSFASGRRAGTSLKTMLQRLAAPTEKAQELMQDLGIQAFDSSGSLKSMNEISLELNDALFGTGTYMKEVGGRTVQQNQDLAALREQYNNTISKIHDYQIGVKGVTLSEEDRAKKIAALSGELEGYEAAMKPLVAITGDMIEAQKEALTDQQVTEVLTKLFGADAVAAAAALAKQGEVAYQTAEEAAAALNLEIEDLEQYAEGGITAYEALMAQMGQTSAADNAATRMQNLAGSMEILQGIVDTIKIGMGDVFLPILKEIADYLGGVFSDNMAGITGTMQSVADAITPVIQALLSGEDPIETIIDALAKLGVPEEALLQIQGVVDAIADFIEKGKAFAEEHAPQLEDALKAVGVALGALMAFGVIASLLNPVLLITAAIVGLAAVIGFNSDAIKAKWEEVKLKAEELKEKLQPLIDIILLVGDYFKTTAESGDPLNDKLGGMPALLQPIVQLYGDLVVALTEVGDSVKEFIAEQGDKIKAWAEENAPLIEAFMVVLRKIGVVFAGIGYVIMMVVPIIQKQLVLLWNVIKPILSGIVDYVLTWVKGLMQAFTGDWEGLGQTLKDLVVIVWETIKNTFLAFTSWILGWFGLTWGDVGTKWAAIWDHFKQVAAAVWVALKASLAKAWDGIKGYFTKSWATFKQAWADLWGGIKDKIVGIWDGIKTYFSDAWAAFKQTWADLWQGVKDIAGAIWQGIKDAIIAKIRALVEAMGFDWDNAVAWLTQTWEDIKLIASTVWENIKASISEKVSAIVLAITTKLLEIVAKWSEKWTEISTAASTIWETIKTTVGTKLADIWTAITTWFTETVTKWSEKWTEISTAMSTVWETIKTTVGTKLLDIWTAIETWFIDTLTKWSEKWYGVKDAMGAIFDEIKTTVGDKLIAVKDELLAKLVEARTAVTDTVDKWKEIGSSIIDGLKQGVIDKAHDLITAAVNAVNNAVTSAKEALGINSPSKVFAEMGDSTMEGMSLGINRSTGDAVQAARKATQAMTGAYRDSLPVTTRAAGTLSRQTANAPAELATKNTPRGGIAGLYGEQGGGITIYGDVNVTADKPEDLLSALLELGGAAG